MTKILRLKNVCDLHNKAGSINYLNIKVKLQKKNIILTFMAFTMYLVAMQMIIICTYV